MTNSPVILVLGATGKAGSRVARILEDNGITVRRASRSSKDVSFAWDDTKSLDATTYSPLTILLESIARKSTYLSMCTMPTLLVLDNESNLRRNELMTSQNTTEENKRIVREFIEAAFNKHQPDKAGEYMTSDIKWHGGTLGTVEGRDNFVGLIGAIVTALPDLRNVELDIIAERDIVSVRATVDGTHKGDLLGIPASGKHVQWDAIDNYRVVDGKISEEWAADDLLAFVYGVGAYTPPWLAGKA